MLVWFVVNDRLQKSSLSIPDHAQNAADWNNEIEPLDSLGGSNSSNDLYVEWIRIQNMKLRWLMLIFYFLFSNFLFRYFFFYVLKSANTY